MLSRPVHALILAVAVSVAGPAACSAAPPDTPARPNILLISVDTLRADHLSSYGHHRETSPFIDSLAAEGVRFEHAYATSSWTVPSVVTMLTGTYRHGMGQRLGKDDKSWSVIPESLPSLAAILQGHGYTTFGLSANLNVPAKRGFDRGFDRFVCIGSEDRDEVEAALTPWLEEISQSEPWFLWLHMFDPHGPYYNREPWGSQFNPHVERYAWVDGMRTETWAKRAPTLPLPIVNAVRALYDSEIRYADEYLRQLFGQLPGAKDAFVLFTSDHGEEFLEHGGTLHARTLFNESIQIPLIVRFPDRRLAGTVVKEVVSLVDVLPTIAGFAGVENVPSTDGLNLFGPDGVTVPKDRIVFSEILRGKRGSVHAMIDGRWKLISDARSGFFLFDQQKDPAEQNNLAEARKTVVERLDAILTDFDKQHSDPEGELEQTPVTPETIEKLKALGYVD